MGIFPLLKLNMDNSIRKSPLDFIQQVVFFFKVNFGFDKDLDFC